VSTGFYFRHPSLRGFWTRTLSMLLGLVIASVLIVGMQLPLLHRPSQSRVVLHRLYPKGPRYLIAWPSVGSAALVIPSIGIAESWHDSVVPIAILTKLMTAYVVLKRLPLAQGETGPCITITSDDVANYEQMKLSDQSSVLVSAGEQLCELDLLNGLLVHSASNYAVLLANMVAGNTTDFIALMNQTAQTLGLTGTHYADVSGFDDNSVSTALDQGVLAAKLMASPLIRAIVDQTSVTLPVAGTVSSFTPYVGVDNVIGVKSGRTAAAGGCDVMAVTFPVGGVTRIAYAVVLGQRGGNLLGPAGDAALVLADTAIKSESGFYLQKGRVFGHIGWGDVTTPFGLADNQQFSWWRAGPGVALSVSARRFTVTIRRGETVGWVVVHATKEHRYRLVAETTVSPPSLWQRLR
jgi:D-alanyl-D-alanine carboxypeptidase (penicillin-binding protein 5/6)